jgi:hypothetical protein
MSDDLRSLVQEHHAFYEVSPYYVSLEENHGSSAATTRKIQAGFEIDVYGVNTKNELSVPGSDPHYALGYAELKKIATKVSQNHADDFCSLSVIPFPDRVVLDNRNHAKEAMLRIRISHFRGLDQPASLSEQHALQELEAELQGYGIARR